MVSNVVEPANSLPPVELLLEISYPLLLRDCDVVVLFITALAIRKDRLLPETVGRLNCDTCRFSRDANAARVAYLIASLMSLGEIPDRLKDSERSIVVPPVGAAVGELVGTPEGCALGWPEG